MDKTICLGRRLRVNVAWGSFSSWAIWPALLVGAYRAPGAQSSSGWANLFWLQGRVGVSWRAKQS
jgi:hypothetical protein